MAIYDFTNFERQGNTENDIQLNSIEEIRQAVIDQTQNALRSIKIFTPDLESEVYNNDQFRKSLLDFSRGNKHAKIEILVEDITTALHNGHQLINLAQQAPSVIKIKDTPVDYHGINITFILFDQSGFILKPDKIALTAISTNCSHRSNRLFEFFQSAWEQAGQNQHTRRIMV